MEELEGHVAMMAWDWDAEDIDPHEDDGKPWVPVTLQMMRMLKSLMDTRAGRLVPTMTPPRQMAIYMVWPN